MFVEMLLSHCFRRCAVISIRWSSLFSVASILCLLTFALLVFPYLFRHPTFVWQDIFRLHKHKHTHISTQLTGGIFKRTIGGKGGHSTRRIYFWPPPIGHRHKCRQKTAGVFYNCVFSVIAVSDHSKCKVRESAF